MDFVHDDQSHLLDVLAILPISGDAVPFLGGRDDDVRGTNCSRVWRGVLRQLNQTMICWAHESPAPVVHTFANKGFHRCDIYNFGLRTRFKETPSVKMVGKCDTKKPFRGYNLSTASL